jgi:hypothetical protein
MFQGPATVNGQIVEPKVPKSLTFAFDAHRARFDSDRAREDLAEQRALIRAKERAAEESKGALRDTMIRQELMRSGGLPIPSLSSLVANAKPIEFTKPKF